MAESQLALHHPGHFYADAFSCAKPFPHVVLEDVLTPAAIELEDEFPPEDWERWVRLSDYYQQGKSSCSDITAIPGRLASLVRELNDPAFLRFLEEMTGIGKLIPDPYLDGGGLHRSGPGGILAPHTDFHDYARLHLYRRLNVLIYLNRGWTRDSGGSLQLFDRASKQPTMTIEPVWGRCVIFATDSESVHGFTQPISSGCVRRSVATYYYTSTPGARFGGDGTTHWHEHGDLRGRDELRMKVASGLRAASRLLLAMSLKLTPNQPRQI